MSHQRIKTVSFCVGGCHQSAKISTDGDISKTGLKFFFGKSAFCNRWKSRIVRDSTKQAEEVSNFLKLLGKTFAKAGTKMAIIATPNPRWKWEIR